MNITRFTQSCMVIEIGETRLVIDPGSDFADAHDVSDLGKVTAVLYTHEHGDHFEPDLFEHFKSQDTMCFANKSLSSLSEGFELVHDKKSFTINNVTIKPIDLDHCLLPNGLSGPQNTGFLINDKFFHPGDGVFLEGLSVDILALPITGPDISMLDAFKFAKQLNAKKVIPIHYDKIGANPSVYSNFAQWIQEPYEFIVIGDGEKVKV